jgi:hypothetical protein
MQNSSDFYFSYSSLNKLLYAPVLFYNHYVLGQKEDKLDSYLVDGRILHCRLLQPKEFDNQFIVAMDKLPSDNVKIVLDKLYRDFPDISNIEDLELEMLTIMKDLNYLQSLKTDKQRVEKMLTEDNKKYFTFVKNANGKTIIDSMTLNRMDILVEMMRANEEISDLLCLNHSEFDIDLEVLNEIPLQYEVAGYSFAGIKGIIDNLVINHKTKQVYINDLKTTGKTLVDFKETIDYYNYWLQMGIYTLLIKEMMVKKQIEDYNINCNFVVVDKYNQIYCFPVSINTMQEWLKKTKHMLKVGDYHIKNNQYSLPYELLKEKYIL